MLHYLGEYLLELVMWNFGRLEKLFGGSSKGSEKSVPLILVLALLQFLELLVKVVDEEVHHGDDAMPLSRLLCRTWQTRTGSCVVSSP